MKQKICRFLFALSFLSPSASFAEVNFTSCNESLAKLHNESWELRDMFSSSERDKLIQLSYGMHDLSQAYMEFFVFGSLGIDAVVPRQKSVIEKTIDLNIERTIELTRLYIDLAKDISAKTNDSVLLEKLKRYRATMTECACLVASDC